MADTKKTITKEQELKAFALFTMASNHYARAREFESALSELLGYPDEDGYYCGCLSDEISQDGGNFARGLKNEGFVVAPDKPNKKQR